MASPPIERVLVRVLGAAALGAATLASPRGAKFAEEADQSAGLVKSTMEETERSVSVLAEKREQKSLPSVSPIFRSPTTSRLRFESCRLGQLTLNKCLGTGKNARSCWTNLLAPTNGST